MAAARQDAGPGTGAEAEPAMELPARTVNQWLMELPIERLALRYVDCVEVVAAGLPRWRWYLADQMRRSASSTYLNLREALGEFSPAEKARIMRISIRSGRETDASLILAARYHPDLAASAAIARKVGNELVPQVVRLARFHSGR